MIRGINMCICYLDDKKYWLVACSRDDEYLVASIGPFDTQHIATVTANFFGQRV